MGSPYEMFVKELLAPTIAADRIWVALSGEDPVGIAVLMVKGMNGGNGITGVARAVRGRGIARCLKLKTIEWSKANSIEAICTENDIENKRMLDINIRLGYVPLPSALSIVKELKEIASP